MARLRTDEEKAAILRECVRLEKEGGDILGFLWSQDYITPRATWFNYQREWLGRKPYQYTDGKPRKKGGTTMKDGKLKEARQKRLEDLVERVGSGMSIRDALRDMGYTGKSAGQIYRQIRNFAQVNDPAMFAALPEKIDGGIAPAASTDDPAKQTEKAPAAGSVPLMYDGYTVRCIESKTFGRFFFDIDHNHLDWTTGEGEEVSFTPQGWKMFLKELPKIMGILGVNA